MLKLAITLCLAVGINAAQFKWIKDNSFNNGDNWVKGSVPTGHADLSNGCLESFGPGGVVKVTSSVTVGELTLMPTGELLLADQVELMISGPTTAGNDDWKCKSELEMNSACSSNYQVKDDQGNWVAADTAPCFDDAILLDGSTSTSLMWNGGQYVKAVEVSTNGSNEIYGTTERVATLDAMMESQMQGDAPIVNDPASCGGAVMCQALCVDVCPVTTLALGAQDRDAFFQLDSSVQEKVLEDARVEQDNLNTIRFNTQNSISSSPELVKQVSQTYQDSYDKNMADAGATKGQGPTLTTIPELSITAALMANWMESAGVGTVHEVHYIRNSLTKDDIEAFVKFFNDVASGNKFYDAEATTPIKLDDQLWSNIAKKGFVRGGRLRRATYKNLVAFVLEDVQKNIATYTNGAAYSIVGFEGPTAAAANSQLDFGGAAGAFELKNIQIQGNDFYTPAGTTDQVSALSPDVVAAAFSLSLVRMALYAKAQDLLFEIHFRPTTTLPPTISPTTSPTEAPTLSPTMAPTETAADALMDNIIPIAAGGGGGFIFIILIIAILVLVVGGSSKKNDDNDNRQTVAFENPMYEEPVHVEEDAQSVHSGTYDEPVIDTNEDKENPMYQSTEELPNQEGGGYLDIAADDEDVEEDNDDDDDENKDDDDEKEDDDENEDDDDDDEDDDDDDDDDDDEDE